MFMLIVSRIFRGLNQKELIKKNIFRGLNQKELIKKKKIYIYIYIYMLPFLHLFWVNFLNCFHICLLSKRIDPNQLITNK